MIIITVIILFFVEFHFIIKRRISWCCGFFFFLNHYIEYFTESEIKNFCSYQKLNSMNGSVYLSRKQYDEISDTCECSIKSSENSIINVNAVDVRLQPRPPIDQNHTGECSNSTYKLTFSNGSDTVSHECENSTIFGEFTPLYSSSGNWVNISYSEGLSDEPQSVWLQVTGAVILYCKTLLC